MYNASYVRNRRATRRTSSHTREAFPAHATLAEAGEPMLGSDVGAWQVLEGSSVAELLAQNSDPLRALSTGEIPAIILRGALDASVAAAVSQRLLMNDQQSLGLFERPGDRKKMARGLLNFGGFGVMLSRTISAKPSKITEDAARYRRLFEQHQLMQPVDTLRRNLEAIAAGRRVGVGLDQTTNASLSVGGAYRMHFNNVSFPVHFDSLHSREILTNSCNRKKNRFYWASVSRGRQAENFPDLYRFPQQFAALITLQRAERAGAEVSVMNLHARDVAKACNVPLFLTQHNVVLEACEATNFFKHEFNAHWHNKYRFDVSDMRRWRNQLRMDALARPLHLLPGDMYIFDANRVHTVHRVWGKLKRLSLGAFVGFSPDEVRIWS